MIEKKQKNKIFFLRSDILVNWSKDQSDKAYIIAIRNNEQQIIWNQFRV